jgi:tRNA(Ile)-lysidine synthase TilS/MesJ
MNTALVLFSGGVDSTYLVFKSASIFDKLVLNTYVVPGMINSGFSRRSADQLKNIFGDKIAHNIIDIRDFISGFRGGVAKAFKDNLDYRFLCSWCLGCRTAMHLYSIDFCRQHGIMVVLEGSNRYDPESLAQNKEVTEFFARMYREQSIELRMPFYEEEGIPVNAEPILSILRRLRFYKDGTVRKVAYLKAQGVDLGWGFVSQYRQTQPSCVTSLFFNTQKALLQRFRREKSDGYLQYLQDKVLVFRGENKT